MSSIAESAGQTAEPPILHIIERAEWGRQRSGGEYRPASLESEGFIHLSTPAQIVETANRFFRGQADLVLLVIDPDCLTPPVRWEPAPDRNAERFPHLYGPLNADAVVRVVDFPPGPDGTFALPREVAVA